MTTDPYRLWQNPGWGSAIVEAQLAFYRLPYVLIDAGDVFADTAARSRVLAVNPLGQLPTLELPAGEVMTESAAITLLLADHAGSDALVPGPGAKERPAFLRWLVFLVANLYPAVSYFDNAQAFLADPAAAESFRRAVAGQKERLWRQIGDALRSQGGPWALGARMSALDIFIAVMVNWRPGRPWFAAEEPELLDIAERLAAAAEFVPVFERNFE